jgi:sialate O-acetylesterase
VEGNKAIVSFDYAESGLAAKGGPLTEFEVAGADRIFYKAQARIVKNNAVEVTSDKVPQPVAVRFAFRDTPVPNLFNKEGLPAIPFRTDDWKLGR